MQHSYYGDVRNLRAVELSGKLPDISISTSDKALVTVSVDGEAVFNEWLFPSNGTIILSELDDLVGLWAYRYQTIDLSITATSEGGTVLLSQQAQVVYCQADVGDETAATYLSNHFLSILQGKKTTALGRLELLPVQGTGETASCTASYSDGTTQVFSVSTWLVQSHFTEYDVSPSHFVSADKTLISYVVTVGNRTQEYELDLDEPDCAPILIFENSFGVDEVVYCTGIHKVAPSYKRSSAYVGRYQRNYHIQETRAFKADTGPLTVAMANWLDELFRSKYVRVANLYNGTVTPGKEVIITDSKSEYSNDDAEIPRFTFTYQYSQRNHNVLQYQRAGRIFDNTFDNTFN